MATNKHLPIVRPHQRAAVFTDADVAAAKQALKRVRLVENIYPETPRGVIVRLAMTAAEMIVNGDAATGLHLQHLCREAQLDVGEVTRAFGAPFLLAAELASRLLLWSGDPEATWERLLSVPVGTGERIEMSLLADKLAGCAASARIMTVSVGTPGCLVTVASTVYTAGTRHDRHSPRVEMDRIARLEEEADGRPIAATFTEHLQDAGAKTDAILSRIREDARIGRISAGQQQVLKRGFSNKLVLPAQPYGTPGKRGVRYREIGYPDDDQYALEKLAGRGTSGIALCSPQTRAATAELAGWQRLTEIDRGRLAVAHGIEPAPEGTWFTFHEDQRLLIRNVAGDAGIERSCWRIFGDQLALADAAALIAINGSSLTKACTDRAVQQGGWGMLSVAKPWIHAGMRAVQHLADVALVTAERTRVIAELEAQEHMRTISSRSATSGS
ncbi:MAG TPA: hypothetical protein VGO29_08960 [Solirubrobacteraceae bacterium]|jgi:hypothetical protein|nr:hypothetical protein [Solirubrobacteraceae bacterium]